MNWLTNFIRPRINSIVGDQKEVPDNLWEKCPSCEGMLFHRDLKAAHNVCYHCNHHLRIRVKDRLTFMYDNGEYDLIDLPSVPHDPLKFKDRKKYVDRIKDTQAKTGLKDAITIAKGTIGGHKTVIAAFNFSFMGGSMGMAVGEAIVKAAETAIEESAAFIVVPSSGGARMQEGILSLMQMPRSIIAVEMVKDEGLPYIVLLTDPTTGGVSASFAMVGDIHLAEPGSMIGFAGRRVIEETVRETGRILGLLMDPTGKNSKSKGKKGGNSSSKDAKGKKSGQKSSDNGTKAAKEALNTVKSAQKAANDAIKPAKAADTAAA